MKYFALKDEITLPDLVEKVVARLHGQGAIAEIERHGYGGEETETSFQINDKLEDASPAIKEAVAIKRAESAESWLEEKGTTEGFEDSWQQHIKPTHRQRPRHVVRAGKKVPSLEDDKRWNGAREKVRVALAKGDMTAYIKPPSDQERSVPRDYWKDDVPASLSVHDGRLMYSPEPEYEGLPVYVKGDAAQNWMTKLGPPSDTPADSGQEEPAPKKKRQPGDHKPSTVAGWKKAHDEIDLFLEGPGKGRSITYAAKMVALDSKDPGRDRRRYIAHLKEAKRQE